MLHISDLQEQANRRLGEVSGNPKKLVLIHTAIALGSSLLLTVITYLCDLLIADTGGLDGLGLRSVLDTAQSVLELLVLIGLPVWQMGIYYAALQWVKGEEADFRSLLQCFRRFGSALGALLLRGAIFFALGIAVFNVSSILFTMTPFSASMLELLAPIQEQGITPEQLQSLLTPEFTDAFIQASIPMLIIFGILYVAVFIPLFYRVRFADFAVMDGLPAGKALLKSLAITRGNCLQVWKVDLSFWWFYLLQMLSVAICYADTLLAALGISLPVSPTVAAFGFYAIGVICQGALLWQYEAKRVTVYGLAYCTLGGTPDGDNTDTVS